MTYTIDLDAISKLQYTELPERARKIIDNSFPPEEEIKRRQQRFRDVVPREPDLEGDVEELLGVRFTHHFVNAPGDHETVRFHYVAAGDPANETILFLHGIPESWFEWHHQMAALASEYHCVAFDLKGYGQSDKTPGDYRHQVAAEQMLGALDIAGIDTFNLITHDRGTVQGDYMAADTDRVLRYGRGEQHLFHFHPDLAPQAEMFQEAAWTGLMNDQADFVVMMYTWIGKYEIADEEMRRIIQEFAYPDVNRGATRYFNSSTFRQEWIERRLRLLAAWKCPIMILEGYDSKTQPREFYEHSREYIPNAKVVEVRYIDSGHYWPMERPDQVTTLIRELLAIPA